MGWGGVVMGVGAQSLQGAANERKITKSTFTRLKKKHPEKGERMGWPQDSYSYSYTVTLFNELFSEESCSVIGFSGKMGFQL